MCFLASNRKHSQVMKKTVLLVPSALALALSLPVQGHKTYQRTNETSDSLVVDTAGDTEYTEDDDWAGTSDDDTATPADTTTDPEDFCTPNDELISDFDTENADYNLQNSKDANAGISFAATLFTPSKEKHGELKKTSGYTMMASRILSSMVDSAAASKWKTEPISKMLENKWKSVKNEYTAEQAEMEKLNGEDFHPMSYSYRTSITPAWQWADKHVTTYAIEDEAYTGGAHGMLYRYYLSLDEKGDSLMGLTDIFKEEALPEVFKLVGEKLRTGPQAANDEETWPSVAEVIPTPNVNDYSVRSGQMQQYKGKWYPRPALTECGIVFVYPPYVKNCYAAGTINILINYVEAKDWLK